MRFSRRAAALATLPFVAAQTFTSCNPTEKSCPSDIGLDSSTFFCDFTQGASASASWSAAAYTTLEYNSQGAEFSISKAGEAPTIQTDFYVFFGLIEVKMKAATGTGIVSSIVLQSDDLDEIDWEFLGGNTAQVETNYFGKGNTTTYDRAIYYQVQTPQETFHTYTIDWNSDRLIYSIDGTAVRTLQYADANGGADYPQTPMRVKLGNWAAGGPGEPLGTVQWAGGNVTFGEGPFTMIVESVSITNYNPAQSYSYGDETGDWQSIKIAKGDGGSGSAPTGSSSGNGTDTALSAPTSMISVAPISNPAAVVSSTVTGSAYSTNSAAISAAQPTATDSGSAASAIDESRPGSTTIDVSGSGSTAIDESGPGSTAIAESGSGSTAIAESGSESTAIDESGPGSTAIDESGPGFTATSVVSASTEPPSAPTATVSCSGTAATATGPLQQTNTSGASANMVQARSSLFAVAMAFWML